MTVRTKVIGRNETDHGPWVPGTVAGKKFHYQLFGCDWESLHDNNNTAPAVWDGGDTITPNLVDWKKVSGSYEAWLMNKDKPATTGTTGDYPYNGMGRVVLKKNIVEDVNTLTHEAFEDSEGNDRENTVYVIQYDFTLGENITVPENCVLEFDGGSISDDGTHTLTGNNTLLSGGIKCLATIAGTFANEYLDVTWFGAKGDDNTDNVGIFENVVNVCRASAINVFIPEGIFAIKAHKMKCFGYSLSQIPPEDREDPVNYMDFHDIKMYGVYGMSIIKSYFNGDVINMSWMKNFHIENLCITTSFGAVEQGGTNGTNLISLVDGENISIRGCKCYNSYWKPRASDSGTAMSEGSGITLQGDTFNNIVVENCEAYNCNKGFDMILLAGFDRHPKSYIKFDGLLAEKCFAGLIVDCQNGYHREEGQINISSGRIFLQGKTVNCKTGCSFERCTGIVATVENVQTETLDQLLTSGYGTSWFRNYDIEHAEDVNKNITVGCGRVSCVTNSNITVYSYAKTVNCGYYLDGSGSNQGYGQYFANNTINLNLNRDAEIVKRKYAADITDENKLMLGNVTFYNSLIIVNGCDYTTYWENKYQYLLNSINETYNTTYILDGRILTKVADFNKIAFHSSTGRISPNTLIYNNTIPVFVNHVSTAGRYMALGIAAPDDDSVQLAFNGFGDIVRPALDTNKNGPVYGYVAGGNGIPVRLPTSLTSISGFIPIHKGRSKGTTAERPTLTVNDAGAVYFDTSLSPTRPIWWNGTKWIKADGTDA